MRFILPAVALLLAADAGGAGGSTKPPSLDEQLTRSQARVTELEALQTAWTTERTQLTGARDTLQTQVTTLTGQVATLTQERDTAQTSVTDLNTKLTAANGTVTTLTRERDEARTLAATPSAQAAAILAAAGAPAVPVKVEANRNPADTGKTASAPGQTGLKAAIAKMNAAKADKTS